MNYTNLSKEISYALRHAPWEYELEMDAKGFVRIHQLLLAVNENKKYERDVADADLRFVVGRSAKKRFEIVGDKIRAVYGHSFPMKINYEAEKPPAVLYHGTARKLLNSIMSEGLKPMNRQYVHLSADVEAAARVGRRRDSNPVVLKIDSERAAENDIIFYHANQNVWLCDFIPIEYISAN